MNYYENSADRIKQSEAVSTVEYHLQSQAYGLAYHLKETDETDRLPYDFTTYYGPIVVGIGEVKCRDRTAEQITNDGWLFERERLNTLRVLCKDRADAIFRMDWQCMLVCRTSDNHVFYTMMHWLAKHRADLKDAPDSWMKTDHGTKDKQATGLVIPSWLLRSAGVINL